MQTRMLAALVGASVVASGALADTTIVNNQVQVRESAVALPKRGSTMEDVEKNFGAPVSRHAAVGGASAAQPPITRWDYNGFSVVFERQYVIDAVVVADASSAAPPSAPLDTPAPAASGSAEPAQPPAAAAAPSTEAAPSPAGSAAPAPDTAVPTTAPATEAPPPPAPAPAPQG